MYKDISAILIPLLLNGGGGFPQGKKQEVWEQEYSGQRADLDEWDVVTEVGATTVEAEQNSRLDTPFLTKVTVAASDEGYGRLNGISSGTKIVAEMVFDPKGLSRPAGLWEFTLLNGRASAGPLSSVFDVPLRWNGTDSYAIRPRAYLDNSGSSTPTAIEISADIHHLRIVCKVSAGAGQDNGYLRTWLDGTLIDQRENLDNDTYRLDGLWFGAVSGVDADCTGELLLSECRWRYG